jgi:hypothetical protein
MQTTFALLLLSLLVTPVFAKSNNLFSDSVRRDPDKEEAKLFVRATKKDRKSGCSGFLVENDQGKALVGSARHCFEYQVTKFCKNGNIRVRPSTDDMSFVGKCEKIVVASLQDDFFIMEVKFHKTEKAGFKKSFHEKILKELSPMVLAAYEPPVHSYLKMYGFPADKYRNSKATVSENCFVQKNSTQYVTRSLSRQQNQDYNARYNRDHRQYFSAKNERLKEIKKKLKINRGMMNCSVYGGNSGGAIVIEGTNHAIGLPNSYQPGLYNVIPSQFGHFYERFKEFVERNKKQLKQAEITLARSL